MKNKNKEHQFFCTPFKPRFLHPCFPPSERNNLNKMSEVRMESSVMSLGSATKETSVFGIPSHLLFQHTSTTLNQAGQNADKSPNLAQVFLPFCCCSYQTPPFFRLHSAFTCSLLLFFQDPEKKSTPYTAFPNTPLIPRSKFWELSDTAQSAVAYHQHGTKNKHTGHRGNLILSAFVEFKIYLGKAYKVLKDYGNHLFKIFICF